VQNTDVRNPKSVDASVLSNLTWSPDGNEIVYAAEAGDGPGLWSVSVHNGKVTRIQTPGLANEPTWSAARQLIAYMSPTSSGPSFTRIAFLDAHGKTFYETLPPPPGPGASEMALQLGRLMAVGSRSSVSQEVA